MSKEQRRALDTMLRKAPQGFTPLPVKAMRNGFAAMMSNFAISDEVTQVPIELAGRPAVLVTPNAGSRPSLHAAPRYGLFHLTTGLRQSILSRQRLKIAWLLTGVC